MRRRRLVAEALRNLVAARQRSFLALLGITVGIASVIAMVSIGAAARAEAEAQFRALGTDLFVIQLIGDQPAGPPTRRVAALETVGRESGVAGTVAAVGFLEGPILHRGKPLADIALGVSNGFFELSAARAARGRLLTALDAGQRFCVLGSNVAGRVGLREPVGERVIIGDRAYTVVGTLAPAPRSQLTAYTLDDSVQVPIEIATRASNESVAFAIGRLDAGLDFRSAVERLKGVLSRKGLDPSIRTAEELLQQMERQSRLFTLLLGAIGAISLVVGGIGVMNVMLSSVTERTREIGLLRALGARRRTIQELFVAEAVLLGAAGGALGVLLGVGAAQVVCRVSGWPFQLSIGAVAIGVTLAVATAIFFGSFPARQAARIHPMTALRS